MLSSLFIGNNRIYFFCQDLQQSSYHLQHDLHQHDNSQGGQQQQPSTTSRQQQQHDIQQQQQQQEHYVVEVQPSNPLG